MFARMTWHQLINDLQQRLSLIYPASEATAISRLYFEEKWNRKGGDETPEYEVQQVIQQDFSKMQHHQPLQQVLQQAWFYGLKFHINEHVLIPRPETEELVDKIVKTIDQLLAHRSESPQKNELQILDIGTGSGCIPIVLKYRFPGAQVMAVDTSKEALTVAQINADHWHTNIQVVHLDFLDSQNWPELGTFDIIISNPPYIPISEKQKLDANVVQWEPHTALFVSNDDPLLFYRRIYEFALTGLKNAGMIFLETHQDYASDVCSLFESSFPNTHSQKDMSGNDRFVICSY